MTNQRINDVDTITTFSGTDRLLINTDVVNNVLEQIKKDDFVADIISTDANNLIEIGTDNKLFSELPSESIFGDTIYGGTIVTDLNTINKNGFYTCYGTATGVPSSSFSWFVIHQNSNAGTASATQRAVAYNSTPIIYERVKTSSTWGAWTLQGSGGGGVVDFDDKGTVTTNITLVENKITTGYWSGTNTITLPTVTDTTKQVVCILDFTTATSGQPTITNTNLKWSDKNGGKAPTAYSIISGVRNLLVFKSIWISSALYWEAEYTTYGGVETTYVRPNLTANGTMGGTSEAVRTSITLYSGSYAYMAVDGNSTTGTISTSGIYNFDYYSPKALKVTNIAITNRNGAAYAITAGAIYGSNDDITYTLIATFTNSITTAGATWNINLSSNTKFYKYIRTSITSYTGEPDIFEWVPTAVYIAT